MQGVPRGEKQMGWTNFPNGITSFGVPVMGGGDPNVGGPIFGNIYYVDGTNGSDDNPGTHPDEAKATIQAAITLQIAETSSLGDVIYIMPGSYAEVLTGDLTKVQIIGVGGSGPLAHMVSIRPTTGPAYTGSMMEASFKNIMFLSPSTDANKTEDAVKLNNMRYSSIEGCNFVGANASCVTGLQIGHEDDDDTSTGHCDYSLIANNIFNTFYGYNSEFTHPIKIGSAGATGAGQNVMVGTRITGNIIYGTTIGMYIGVVAGAQYGSVIDHNFISSGSREHGCATSGITNIAAGATILVVENWINAEDALVNFNTAATLNNTVSDAGIAAKELPASS
jgi:hypothetical protein